MFKVKKYLHINFFSFISARITLAQKDLFTGDVSSTMGVSFQMRVRVAFLLPVKWLSKERN